MTPESSSSRPMTIDRVPGGTSTSTGALPPRYGLTASNSTHSTPDATAATAASARTANVFATSDFIRRPPQIRLALSQPWAGNQENSGATAPPPCDRRLGPASLGSRQPRSEPDVPPCWSGAHPTAGLRAPDALPGPF